MVDETLYYAIVRIKEQYYCFRFHSKDYVLIQLESSYMRILRQNELHCT